MSLKINANLNDPPIGALITANIISSTSKINIEVNYPNPWKFNSNIQLFNNNELICENDHDVARYLARTFDKTLYGGDNILDRTQIDSWMTFCLGQLSNKKTRQTSLEYLENSLKIRTYLVSGKLTLADIFIYSTLLSTQTPTNELPNITRWSKLIQTLPSIQKLPQSKPTPEKKPIKETKEKNPVRKNEGKFVDLPNAELGKVVVRFPPEASGYLHIGHAKAALLNQYYAELFQGQLIMRFDDTNPAKENVEYEQEILKDLELLEIKPDRFTHTSNYFDIMLTYCETLIKNNKAFVDNSPAHIMKEEREQRKPSKNRNNPVELNLQLWKEMIDGSEIGQQNCVRAKIDHESTNGCMRDPTIYRCKPESHPRTGNKYNVYPTYDFACPIVDAIEGVTHTLRTTEYHDRDEQFYWFIEQLNLRRPYIYEYSRLNMTNTVLSKRKLTWFVDEGIVDGWDDPRFPTVRGILRRGMTIKGLKQFIIAQGSSRSVVFMEWDKIWAFNKKFIDASAIRYTALNQDELVLVVVKGVDEGFLRVQNHPKDVELGMKSVRIGDRLFIERCDAELLVEGKNATFVNWGNLMIERVVRVDGVVGRVEARLNLEDRDYKNTVKLTWLAGSKLGVEGLKGSYDLESVEVLTSGLIPCVAVYFEHIISKAVVGKDEDFKDYVAKDTRKEVMLLGEEELKRVKQGEIIQLQRKGFFRCDVPYAPMSDFSSRVRPLILFNIPDGHATTQLNSLTTTTSKTTVAKDNKETEIKSSGNNKNVEEILKKINIQGDKVRELKSKKADKKTIDSEVKELLNLKSEYKTLTNCDWKPGVAPPSEPSITNFSSTPTITIELDDQIKNQGNKVRDLKTAKADKEILDFEVKKLLALKSEFKNCFGKDWKPTNTPPSPATTIKSNDVELINKQITEVGDKIRKLKSDKSTSKKIIEDEVKILLNLKENYKKLSGSDWKPNTAPPSAPSSKTNDKMDEVTLNKKITEQGDKIRQLKSNKSDKKLLDPEIKILLSLKNDYKSLTGNDWTPSSSTNDKMDEVTLNKKITEQGDKIRQLKSNKSDKKLLDPEIKLLLNLKNDYKSLTGNDWTPSTPAPTSALSKKNPEPKNSPSKPDKKNPQAQSKKKDPEAAKTGTRLGLEASKKDNLSDWYSQVITKGEMIEYYDVSGCYILRPWSYSIWEVIKDFFDHEIKKLGVKNCYFPIFVSKSVLEREKTHIADFAPEVAWVTKSGDSDLAEPIAIRPTSETVMYPAYAKWLKSHRDLPLKLNQWNNVVRWEFKHPQPFLRTREFLWQEGHSAFLTQNEAADEVLVILELYAKIYEDLLGIPVVRGRKTEKEKFAGGDWTTTIEAYVGASGRAIQGATSHHLGQNFSRMFDIQVESADEGEKIFVYQNSWGITTRTIGVMIMVHGDDKGLILPPRVAAVQVVIVPCGITATTTMKQREELMEECEKLEKELGFKGVLRVEGDYRDNYSPGWKFNHWELKGVPLRVELGFKDLEKNQVTLVRRDNSERILVGRRGVFEAVKETLDNIQRNMFDKANAELKEHIKQCTDWKSFCEELEKKNLLLSPFCGEISCEDKIKADSTRDDNSEEGGEQSGAPSMGAKSLCIPFDQPKETPLTSSSKCIHPSCKNKPKFYTLFGRSY